MTPVITYQPTTQLDLRQDRGLSYDESNRHIRLVF